MPGLKDLLFDGMSGSRTVSTSFTLGEAIPLEVHICDAGFEGGFELEAFTQDWLVGTSAEAGKDLVDFLPVVRLGTRAKIWSVGTFVIRAKYFETHEILCKWESVTCT